MRSTRNRNNRRKPKNSSSNVQIEKYLKTMALRDMNELMTPKVPDVLPLELKREKVYTFSRTTFNPLTMSGTADTNSFGYSYTIGDVFGVADFTSLFDQYRIIQIQVRFMPVYGPGEFPGVIYTHIDYDDDNQETISQMVQDQTLQATELFQPWVRTFNPLVAIPVYENAIITGYGSGLPGQWIDAASTGIKYYGLKLAAPIITGAPASIVVGQLVATYIVQGRHPR